MGKTKSTVLRGKLTFPLQSPVPTVLQRSPCLACSPFAMPPGPACLEDLDVSYCTHTSAFKCLTHLFLSCLHGPECQGLQEQKGLHQKMGRPVGLVWPREPRGPRSQCPAGHSVSTPLSPGESTQPSGLPSASLLPHPPLSFPATHGREEQQRKTRAFGVTTLWSS